jgi:hypothetical protein
VLLHTLHFADKKNAMIKKEWQSGLQRIIAVGVLGIFLLHIRLFQAAVDRIV